MASTSARAKFADASVDAVKAAKATLIHALHSTLLRPSTLRLQHVLINEVHDGPARSTPRPLQRRVCACLQTGTEAGG